MTGTKLQSKKNDYKHEIGLDLHKKNPNNKRFHPIISMLNDHHKNIPLNARKEFLLHFLLHIIYKPDLSYLNKELQIMNAIKKILSKPQNEGDELTYFNKIEVMEEMSSGLDNIIKSTLRGFEKMSNELTPKQTSQMVEIIFHVASMEQKLEEKLKLIKNIPISPESDSRLNTLLSDLAGYSLRELVDDLLQVTNPKALSKHIKKILEIEEALSKKINVIQSEILQIKEKINTQMSADESIATEDKLKDLELMLQVLVETHQIIEDESKILNNDIYQLQLIVESKRSSLLQKSLAEEEIEQIVENSPENIRNALREIARNFTNDVNPENRLKRFEVLVKDEIHNAMNEIQNEKRILGKIQNKKPEIFDTSSINIKLKTIEELQQSTFESPEQALTNAEEMLRLMSEIESERRTKAEAIKESELQYKQAQFDSKNQFNLELIKGLVKIKEYIGEELKPKILTEIESIGKPQDSQDSRNSLYYQKPSTTFSKSIKASVLANPSVTPKPDKPRH